MPDLGKYAFEVTLAYGVSLTLLAALVVLSVARARRIGPVGFDLPADPELREAERREAQQQQQRARVREDDRRC
mgnify:CR=1 FL=1